MIQYDNSTAMKGNSQGSTLQEGLYPLQGKQFKIGERIFLIRERKNPTTVKPRLFISKIKPEPYIYISSLYPTDENTFKMDYNKDKYTVQLTDDSITINKACDPR
jgi:hypothetical protein